jgi:hypothetical protein
MYVDLTLDSAWLYRLAQKARRLLSGENATTRNTALLAKFNSLTTLAAQTRIITASGMIRIFTISTRQKFPAELVPLYRTIFEADSA